MGWFLIPLTIILFLSAPRWLYVLVIFFIPFSATAIINVKPLVFGIPVSIFIGSFWILSVVLNTIKTFRFKLPSYRGKSLVLLVVFSIIVLLSLMMPIIIDGKISTASDRLNGKELYPLFLMPRHIVQALYLIYGVIFTTMISAKNSRLLEFKRSIRIYVLSSIFVSLWGWLQWSLYHLNMPYPAYIFNNSITPSAANFAAEMGIIKTIKVSSVAVEASILAQYLLTVIPIILFALISKKVIISRFIDRLAFALTVSSLFISGSTTGYIGILFLFLLVIIMLFLLRVFRERYFYWIIASLFACISVYAFIPAAKVLINETLFYKIESYSFAERLRNIINAWGYFLEYPLLGIGWGSFTCPDLIVKLLAGTGAIGFASFIALIVYVFIQLKKSLTVHIPYESSDSNAVRLMGVAMGCSFYTLLFACILSSLYFVFSYLWFIAGMVIAVISIVNKDNYSRLIKGNNTLS